MVWKRFEPVASLRPRLQQRRRRENSLCRRGRRRRQLAELVPLEHSHRLHGPARSPPHGHQQLADEITRPSGQRRQFDAHLARAIDRHAAIEPGVDVVVDHGLGFAGQRAEPQQRLRRLPALKCFCKRGNSWWRIRLRVKRGSTLLAVVATRLAERVEVGDQFRAADAEQGPNEHGMSQRPCPRHARKSANARAAKNSVQHGLGLIVGRMGGGDEAGAEPSGGLFQEAVSRRAGGGFDAVARGRQLIDVDVADLARHVEPAAQIDDEPLVVIGVGAQADGSDGRRKGVRRRRSSRPPSPATVPRYRLRPRRPPAPSRRPRPTAAKLRPVWFRVDGAWESRRCSRQWQSAVVSAA